MSRVLSKGHPCLRIPPLPLLLLITSVTAANFEADALPGWLGESHQTKPSIDGSTSSRPVSTEPRIVQLSWKPRAFLYRGFLSDEECEHIKKLATPSLERSTVVDPESRKSVVDTYRSSFGTFLDKGQDDAIVDIEERIARWTFLPVENQEAMQVLRYSTGQKYDDHHDFFEDPENKQQGGHRYATVLMYLADVAKGGETVFPSSEDPAAKDDTWSECGKRGLAVKPRKGDALLFFSLHPSAKPDLSSLHSGCPVIEGEKWSATKWIHVRSFDEVVVPSACQDEDVTNCPRWAEQGECEKNPVYMVGNEHTLGNCRKSCKVCQ